ncbi:MAG TPA: AAA family ATPase [Acidimicrobiales bacterium]|nr:AAA family ATPase [Acidimicrobiales bacterium]
MLKADAPFRNPYTPGAGHPPPYLAGREGELAEFQRLLQQDTILENLVLTGLRGLGKTVLMDVFKPLAIQAGWLWAGSDLSESASVSEASLAIRIMTDLSIAATGVTAQMPARRIGFQGQQQTFETVGLSFDALYDIYDSTPGLASDRLRAVLEYAWTFLEVHSKNHIIFAYDEAQNLADHAKADEFPLSTLLDLFQSIQRRGIPFMLVLTGLPTLFPKLVEARTFAERMFRVVTLSRLVESESRDAVKKPIEQAGCPVTFSEDSVAVIVSESAGYPYFIQFICREVYDIFIQQVAAAGTAGAVPFDSIQRKLDDDFFAGRWARVTDRQRDLMYVIALLDHPDEEFTIQEIVEKSKAELEKGFSSSHVNQMLGALSSHGLVYKNRFGKYSFAVPLLGKFILRIYRTT